MGCFIGITHVFFSSSLPVDWLVWSFESSDFYLFQKSRQNFGAELASTLTDAIGDRMYIFKVYI